MATNYKTVKQVGLRGSVSDDVIVTPSDWRKDPMTYVLAVGLVVLTLTNLTPLVTIWITDPTQAAQITQTITVITGYLGVISAWLVRVFNIKAPITFDP